MASTASYNESQPFCRAIGKETEYGTADDLPLTSSKAKKFPCLFSLCDYFCLSILIICVIAILGLPTLFHFLPFELVRYIYDE